MTCTVQDCRRAVHHAGLCHMHVRTRPGRRRIEALPGPTILRRGH